MVNILKAINVSLQDSAEQLYHLVEDRAIIHKEQLNKNIGTNQEIVDLYSAEQLYHLVEDRAIIHKEQLNKNIGTDQEIVDLYRTMGLDRAANIIECYFKADEVREGLEENGYDKDMKIMPSEFVLKQALNEIENFEMDVKNDYVENYQKLNENLGFLMKNRYYNAYKQILEKVKNEDYQNLAKNIDTTIKNNVLEDQELGKILQEIRDSAEILAKEESDLNPEEFIKSMYFLEKLDKEKYDNFREILEGLGSRNMIVSYLPDRLMPNGHSIIPIGVKDITAVTRDQRKKIGEIAPALQELQKIDPKLSVDIRKAYRAGNTKEIDSMIDRMLLDKHSIDVRKDLEPMYLKRLVHIDKNELTLLRIHDKMEDIYSEVKKPKKISVSIPEEYSDVVGLLEFNPHNGVF